jgi:hypothetical protein
MVIFSNFKGEKNICSLSNHTFSQINFHFDNQIIHGEKVYWSKYFINYKKNKEDHMTLACSLDLVVLDFLWD